MKTHEIQATNCQACGTEYDAAYMACPECGYAQHDEPTVAPLSDEELADLEQEPDPEPSTPNPYGLQPGEHHPDCSCNDCHYGADAARWLFNPSEY